MMRPRREAILHPLLAIGATGRSVLHERMPGKSRLQNYPVGFLPRSGCKITNVVTHH
jgi:hypothetical protein